MINALLNDITKLIKLLYKFLSIYLFINFDKYFNKLYNE